MLIMTTKNQLAQSLDKAGSQLQRQCGLVGDVETRDVHSDEEPPVITPRTFTATKYHLGTLITRDCTQTWGPDGVVR